MKLDFSRVKDKITGFSSPINWITASGLGEDELASMVSDIENAESSKAIIRAKTSSVGSNSPTCRLPSSRMPMTIRM